LAALLVFTIVLTLRTCRVTPPFIPLIRSVIRRPSDLNQTFMMRFTQNDREFPRRAKDRNVVASTQFCPEFHASPAFDPRLLRCVARGVCVIYFFVGEAKLVKR
jgi:hypothetical protein